MPNSYFQFKQFTIHQERCSMKVTTDSCLFGAWVADQIADNPAIANMLDIGSGSGLLSLMLAQKNDALIDCIELQPDDYEQGKANIENSKFGTRINPLLGDAVSFNYPHTYDLIISNPPFYENELKGESSGRNIAHHDEGLTLEQLVKIINTQLNPQGECYLLLPAKRQEAVANILRTHGLHINRLALMYQTDRHSRPFRLMLRASKEEKAGSTERLIIRENENYSERFRFLLRDYYLKL
ncbi:tRNA1(Val) (adenine(37)-N6)-methyltransferase [Niabella insulamsoli]|uniref:tRNA1(Val) (adenine(37)-N6)-methyltransferase n=1 Tax=Niabella insulamsoli TaxID=3144874 RepID=UPI0031FE16EA